MKISQENQHPAYRHKLHRSLLNHFHVWMFLFNDICFTLLAWEQKEEPEASHWSSSCCLQCLRLLGHTSPQRSTEPLKCVWSRGGAQLMCRLSHKLFYDDFYLMSFILFFWMLNKIITVKWEIVNQPNINVGMWGEMWEIKELVA